MTVTYDSIATTTLSSAASTITFSSIPNTFTDLRIVLVEFNSGGGNACNMRFNSDSGTNYSRTWIFADGQSVESLRSTNGTQINIRQGGTISTTLPGLMEVDIFSYAGSTNKTVLTRASIDQNGSAGVLTYQVGLWRNTAAITNITLTPSTQFSAGTTATLYGIKAE